MSCGPLRHEWQVGTTSWRKGEFEDVLTQVHITCRRCGVERWRLVGPWNRKRWLARVGYRALHNPECLACRPFDPGRFGLGLGTTCSRSGCDRPAVEAAIHVFEHGSRRWSYLCGPCSTEHHAWFYGAPGSGTEGWLFTSPRRIVT